jgi:prephenate dehydrogenase
MTTDLGVVGIVGLGLIGGSIAKSLLRQGVTVQGFDPDAATKRTASNDGVTMAGSVADLVAGSDMVVLAPPLAALDQVVRETAEATSKQKRSVVVTDVGSVKEPFSRLVERLRVSDSSARWVGGHPMAGTEKAGYASSTETMFLGAAWVISPTAATDVHSFTRAAQLALSCGAHVVPLDASIHDDAVARISHLPYLLAAALSSVACATDGWSALNLAAGSFRDMTRVAGSDPSFPTMLCTANRHALGSVLDESISQLMAVKETLAGGEPDAVHDFFYRGNAVRERLMNAQRQKRVLAVPPGDNEAALDELLDAGARGARITGFDAQADGTVTVELLEPADQLLSS